jgi:hypothetical protein
MKNLTEVTLLKENLLIYKKIFNFGLYTQFILIFI